MHDYRCLGLHHLPAGPALLVGYHGRPALDSFLLLALMAQLGRPLRGVAHRVWFDTPGVAGFARGLGLLSGQASALEAVLRAGEPVLLLPGGTRECFRSSRVLYQLDWGQRQGYARLAVRLGVPVLPFAATGVDELYRIYGDGYRISKALTGTDLLPLCLPMGCRGLPLWPFFPVQVHQRIAPPIYPESGPDAVNRLDQAVRAAIGELLEQGRQGPIPADQGLSLHP